MSLRVIIVDDEPLARRRLKRLLQSHEDVEVLAEAANGDEAVSLVLDGKPDAVFMDVRMPGTDGLTALRRLREKLPGDVMPKVVFTTAYEDHAVEAFELDGTDYLVKPIDRAALARAMQRVRRGTWRRDRDVEPAAETTATVAGPAVGAQRESGGRDAEGVGHLAAHRAGKIIRLALEDVACIVVEDTITWAITVDGKFRLRQALGKLEKRLSCPPFFRVSRSAMVNLDWIDHLAPMFSGTYSAYLKDPVELEVHVSRRRARELRQLLGW